MKKKHLLALVLALSLVLGLTGPALAAETAADMIVNNFAEVADLGAILQ